MIQFLFKKRCAAASRTKSASRGYALPDFEGTGREHCTEWRVLPGDLMEQATNQDVPDFRENDDDSSYGLERRSGIMHWSSPSVLADFASPSSY
jgi:hypothetical protein